jgi:transposase InsO family protein
MGSRGDALDNAMCESFFASLETELLDRVAFATRERARMGLFDWIEGFYNSHRLHSALGYLSPVEFERRQALTYVLAA